MLCNRLKGIAIAVAAAFWAQFPQQAIAGIVNVVSATDNDVSEGFSGVVSASLDLNSGNSDLLLVGLSPVARYRAGDHFVVGTARGEYGKSNDERVLLRSFEHLRYRYRVSPAWSGEVFAQHAFDEFRRLNLRALLGVGPRFDVWKREGAQVGLGLAYMLEYERLRDTGDEDDAGESRLDHRLSSYITGRFSLADRVDFKQTLYAQPRFDLPHDIRLLSVSQISTRVTQHLAVTTSLSVVHDSRPPDAVDRTDVTLKSGISWSF